MTGRTIPNRPAAWRTFLKRYAQSAFLDIELKVDGLEDLVVAALRQNPPQRDYVVSSFLHDVLGAVQQRCPNIPLGYICDKESNLSFCFSCPQQAAIVHHRFILPGLVQRLHMAGKQVFAWTVNDQREMLRLAEWGVDAIISDDTELLSRMFAGR